MHMVFSYCQFFQFIIILLCNALEKLVYIFPEVTTEDPFPILRCPNKMVVRFVNCMSGTFDCHAVIISQYACVWKKSSCSGHRVHRMMVEFIPE